MCVIVSPGVGEMRFSLCCGTPLRDSVFVCVFCRVPRVDVCACVCMLFVFSDARARAFSESRQWWRTSDCSDDASILNQSTLSVSCGNQSFFIVN